MYVPRALRTSLPAATALITNSTPSAGINTSPVPSRNNTARLPIGNSTCSVSCDKTISSVSGHTSFSCQENQEFTANRTQKIVPNVRKCSSDNSIRNVAANIDQDTATNKDHIPYNADIPNTCDSIISKSATLMEDTESSKSVPNNIVDDSSLTQVVHTTSQLDTSNKQITIDNQFLAAEQNETLKILNETVDKINKGSSINENLFRYNSLETTSEIIDLKLDDTISDINTPNAQVITNSQHKNSTISAFATDEDATQMEVDVKNTKNISEDSEMDIDENMVVDFKVNTSDKTIDPVNVVEDTGASDNSQLEKQCLSESGEIITENTQTNDVSEHVNSKPNEEILQHVRNESSVPQTQYSSSKLETNTNELSPQGKEYAIINVSHCEVPSKVRLIETRSIVDKSSQTTFDTQLEKLSANVFIKDSASHNSSNTVCDNSAWVETVQTSSNKEISLLDLCESSESTLTNPLPDCYEPMKTVESNEESDKSEPSPKEVESPVPKLRSPTKLVSKDSSNVPLSPSKAESHVNSGSSKTSNPPPSDTSTNVLPISKSEVITNVGSPSKESPTASSTPSSEVGPTPTTPASSKSTGCTGQPKSTSPVDLDPDECDWETLYDDDGECLVPDIVNEV